MFCLFNDSDSSFQILPAISPIFTGILPDLEIVIATAERAVFFYIGDPVFVIIGLLSVNIILF